MNYRIFPPDDLLQTRIDLPLSKSESNRALAIAAFTPDASLPERMADCADTRAMTAALTSQSDNINIGAAGTAMRFLTAYFACCCGRTVTLDGSERMRNRPIGPLVDALRSCGASIEYAGKEGFPPLRIEGRSLKGGTVSIDATISSQYISALMMAAPTMTDGLTLSLVGEVASATYIALTADMMRRAGIDVEISASEIIIHPGKYAPVDWHIGADWSAASYWYEIEALTSGFVTLNGLDAASCQPDRAVADIFSNLGVQTCFEGEDGGIDLLASPDLSPRLSIDLSNNPDLAQTIVVSCVMIGIPFHISGLSSLRIKETDRIDALMKELLKTGVIIEEETPGTLVWDGTRRPLTSLPEFDTYDDHRMALAFAPVALYIPGIVIRNPEVVSKSYPSYWDDLKTAGFLIVDADLPEDELRQLLESRQQEE